MKKFIISHEKSITNRVKYAFIFVIMIISAGFIFSIYVRDIISKKYNTYMDTNIKLNELSLELNNSWSFFDMYIRTKNKDYIEKYISCNNKVRDTMYEILPYIQKDKDSSIYLRTLNNMFDSYETDSNNLILQEKLDEKSYDKLVELKTLVVYINKHAELLTVSYLNYSDVEYSSTFKKYKNTELEIYIVLMCIIAVSFIYAMFVSRDLNVTIGKLRTYAKLLSDANWEIEDLGEQKYYELNSLANAFNKMKTSIRAFITELNKKAEIENNYHKEKLKSAEKDKLVKETQLMALQSQVNPHFLFNTLNTISRMAMFEYANNTVELIEATSKILRYGLNYKDKLVDLKEEINMIKAYVTIQETRFQDQMNFIFDIDSNIDFVAVPPMIIQPLVENAIIHGLREKIKGGIIKILIKKQASFISISITDNGKGIEVNSLRSLMATELNNSTNENSSKITKLGVSNVRKRLELYFNKTDLFNIESKENEGTKVTILIPTKVGE